MIIQTVNRYIMLIWLNFFHEQKKIDLKSTEFG